MDEGPEGRPPVPKPFDPAGYLKKSRQPADQPASPEPPQASPSEWAVPDSTPFMPSSGEFEPAPAAPVRKQAPASYSKDSPLPVSWIPSDAVVPVRPPRTAVLAVGIVALVLLAAVAIGWMLLKHPPAAAVASLPASPVQTGSLSIASTPAGAKVAVNGEDRGTTPLVLKDLHASIYQVELRKAGYLPARKQIGLDGGQSLTENFTLVRPGVVVLKGLPRDRKILVDGSEERTKSFTLEPGKHRIVVRSDGYQEFNQQLQVTAGKTLTVTVRLQAVAEAEAPTPEASATAPAPSTPHVVVMPAPHEVHTVGPGYAPAAPPAAPAPAAPAPAAPPPAAAAPQMPSGVVVGERHDTAPPSPQQTNGIPGL